MTTASSSSASPTGNAPGKFTTSWIDGTGRLWRIEADATRVMFVADEDVLDLPSESWLRDIYVTAHDDGYIIRIENFDHSIGFVVSQAQADGLVSILGRTKAETDVSGVDTAHDGEQTQGPSRMELHWPQVSPLAVWALICAAPAFVPVLGWPPAIASVVLLVLHHRRVPASPVWRHSRALCVAAVIFLVAGVVVSLLGTFASIRSATAAEAASAVARHDGDAPPHPDDLTAAVRASAPIVERASFLEDDHNWGLIIAGLVVILLSLTIHEAAHAITAWWLGDDFAKRLGRVTINPLVHIDPLGTVILPLILFLSGMMVFGWAKSVPVRTDALERPRRAHILISLAGPGSNLLLAAASLLLLLGITSGVWIAAPTATIENLYGLEQSVHASGFALAPIVGPACTVLRLSFLINTFLAFFNLIPIPPLDGSWVLEHAFPRTLGPFYARLRPYAFMLFLGLMYVGVLEWLLVPAFYAVAAGFAVITSCTPF